MGCAAFGIGAITLLMFACVVVQDSADRKAHLVADASPTGVGPATPSFGMPVWAGGEAVIRKAPKRGASQVRAPGRGELLTVAVPASGDAPWYAVLGSSAADTVGYVRAAAVRHQRPQPLDVESWTWYKDPEFGGDGAVIWSAMVRNNTGVYVENAQVEFTSYDASGQIVDTDFGYATGLSPGGTASVKGYATYFGRERRAEIRVVR